MIKKVFQNVNFWQFIGRVMPVSILIINKTGDIVFRNNVFNNIIKPNYNNLFHFMSEESLGKLNEDVAQATEHHKIVSNHLKLQKTINESLYFIYYLIPLSKRSAYVLVLVETTEIHNKNIMFNNIIVNGRAIMRHVKVVH
jgi:hypothetical protein